MVEEHMVLQEERIPWETTYDTLVAQGYWFNPTSSPKDVYTWAMRQACLNKNHPGDLSPGWFYYEIS
jgi:hypothetical protein